MVKSFTIHKNLPIPKGRGSREQTLKNLITLANTMNVGDAVELSLSETNTFRTVLRTLGYECITDGWRCPNPTKILAFKVHQKD